MTIPLSPGVYIKEEDRGTRPIEGVGTAVAAFVGFTAKLPNDDPTDPDGIRPRLVTNWMQYERLFGGFVEGALLPHAVFGYFANGGGRAYIVRVPHRDPVRRALPSGTRKDVKTTLEVIALEAGQRLEIIVQPDQEQPGDTKKGKSPSTPPAGEPGGQPAGEPGGAAEPAVGVAEREQTPATFTLTVRREGQDVESFQRLTVGGPGRDVESVVNSESRLVGVRAVDMPNVDPADRLPAPGQYVLEGEAAERLTVGPTELVGSESARAGVRGLVIADEVTMISVPDLFTAASRPDGSVDGELFTSVQSALIEHCEMTRDRIAILDAPPDMSPQNVSDWRSDEAMYDSRYAVLYYPWIKVDNPLARSGDPKNGMILVPPSGHMAGIWARSDDTRGVWKAPANEIVRGARDVAIKVTEKEQDLLNPLGINCIRPFGIRGIRVWGARTLSSDAHWRYVNVRRLFNYIEESIQRGTQWVVFEPNGRDLWQRVKRSLFSFLFSLWQNGALAGANPDQAFFIKCDEENNPPSDVEKGLLTIDVGVAASRPAEFVVIRISQWQGAELAAS